MNRGLGVLRRNVLDGRDSSGRRAPRIRAVVLTVLVVLFCLALTLTVSSAQAQQRGEASDSALADGKRFGSPNRIDLDGLSAPDSAKGVKIEAIRIVESMDYPDPDVTPPGKDQRKEYILKELEASVDGTFRSDNFLEDGSAFEHDLKAAKRLRQMLSDPKVDSNTKGKARNALKQIYRANRLITTEVIGATDLFGDDLPKKAAKSLKRAEQELAKGDRMASQGKAVNAIRFYKKAWSLTDITIDDLWERFDSDSDDLLDWQEKRLGTYPAKADTDSDGLTDGEELYKTGTDPTRADPQNMDRDRDGLTDRREIEAGTNSLRADTDGDGLNDRFELAEFRSNPTKKDTDADGLEDDSERRLGTNPRNPDSDADGTEDGLEVYTSQAQMNGDTGANEAKVAVQMIGIGDVAAGVDFQDLSEHETFQDMPGQLSKAVDITSGEDFDKARVKIPFDVSRVPNEDYENLQIMYFDEGQKTFLPFNEGGVDVEEGYAWADTDHFTTFVLFHIPTWEAVWQKDMGSGGGGRDESDPNDPDLKNLDVMLNLDSSGSMRSNDRQGYRKTAAKSFIDALIEGDRVGVVDFDSYARLYQSLTADYPAAKAAVDRVNSSGGTNIGRAIALSNRELIDNGDPEHLKATVLLTDGQGSYNSSLTRQAKEAGITIYTIGLGNGADEGLLRSIAEGTGGAYYPVTSAEDLPEVFRRIAEDPDGAPGEDDGTDTDGLTDFIEENGFRAGNGTFFTSDPEDTDTDGDGLTDGEEAGELSEGTFGEYYPLSTDPDSADTDGDTLGDFEDSNMGLDPNLADVDGDSVDDATELAENFDPLDSNPDNDDLEDAEELEQGSDPFYPDRVGLENIKDTAIGWNNGANGEDLANQGRLDSETLRSLGYLEGWIASNLTPALSLIAGLRDADIALGEGDLESALVSLIGGASPTPMDKANAIADIINTFVSWNEDLKEDVARWSAANAFMQAVSSQVGELTTGQDLTLRVLYELGWGDDILAALRQTMPGEDAEQTIKDLAESRNDPGIIRESLSNGAQLNKKLYTSREWNEVTRKTENAENWSKAKLDRSRVNLVEAYSVEGAVNLLESEGYRMLYVGRNKPVTLKVPNTKRTESLRIKQGPDIVAIKGNPSNPSELAIIEVKSSSIKDKPLSVNSTLLKTSMAEGYHQPFWQWLEKNSGSRYVNKMLRAENPEIEQAGKLLDEVVRQKRTYKAVVIGYGEGGTKLGDIDTAVREVGYTDIESGYRGVTGTKVYTINVEQ